MFITVTEKETGQKRSVATEAIKQFSDQMLCTKDGPMAVLETHDKIKELIANAQAKHVCKREDSQPDWLKTKAGKMLRTGAKIMLKAAGELAKERNPDPKELEREAEIDALCTQIINRAKNQQK